MIRWHAPGPYEIVFSTRTGGVSEGPFASLNLGRRTGDDPARVEENRRRLCGEIGADPAHLSLGFQHHSPVVNRAQPGVRGIRGDGLWSNEPGVPLLVLGADCLPVALVRTNGAPPAVALLHAGWRGLLEGIVRAGVEALGAGTVAAAIGPGIGPCCYEVHEDVADPFRQRFGDEIVRSERLDLWTAAELSLREAGVSSVERLDLCTACNPDRFFSYRRDGTLTGAQGVVALVR